MQLALPGRPHLSYCTNVHPGETWSEIGSALASHLPQIKKQISPDAAMGVGLRLSAIAAMELAVPATLGEFKSFLESHDLYVFTVNAFPYGPFHGQRVKEHVYEPDWRQPERLEFTKCVANILSELTPVGFESSISTVPGAFKACIDGPDDVSRMTEALISCAAHLYQIEQRSSRTVILALEPEPACFLETTSHAIDFFNQHLFAAPAVAKFADLTGTTSGKAAEALRRHLGLCLDVCHSSVAFEDPAPTIDAIARAGISIAKLQLSSALRVARAGPEMESVLAKFDDGIYLHQTVVEQDGALMRYLDLPDALAALRSGRAGGEWRVHCHVPVFADAFDGLLSTQNSLRQILNLCRSREISQHLEVETYTWGVLPPDMRDNNLSDDIVRELTWVREELGA